MSELPEDYEDLRDELYNHLYRKLERKDENAKRFAAQGTAKEVLHSYVLRHLFSALTSPDRPKRPPPFTINQAHFSELINEHELHDFLAVLIFASCNIDAVWTFVQKLVQPNEEENTLLPVRLPVEKEYLQRVFGSGNPTVNKFYDAQACFATLVIKKGEKNVLKKPHLHRLPWLEEKMLGEGNFGTVRMVRIAKGHFLGWNGPQPAEIARKDYELNKDAEENFENEANMMARILQRSKHNNILASLGTLKIESNPPVFSLFMPRAEEDLQQYMKRGQGAPHGCLSTNSRARIIRSALGLAHGLQFLHSEMTIAGQDDLICYHMDLKPNNVLVFRDDRGDRSDRHEDDRIWKLSDFGMSKVRVIPKQVSGERGPTEIDLGQWFKRAPPESSPGTRVPRGASTYISSELATGKKVNEKSDVWSMGCIVSVLFTFMEYGWDGVEEYSKSRQKESHQNMDVFYAKDSFIRDNKINSAIRPQHANLIAKAGTRTKEEKSAVERILGFLEGKVLKINEKRCNAKELADCLEKTWSTYKSICEQTPAPESEGREPKQRPFSKLWKRNPLSTM
ncbi:protein kinase domain-containing protein [Colletotrichum tofieldiae]|uniref:Protein kinase domain-containing protein n=1 Tax=Colletotrichum tofieldiae TaxID=708197 RepID=A0A166NA84_9PEZI|nr:protein kinase domain-containing protein [Colletotrichum tofieldiae]